MANTHAFIQEVSRLIFLAKFKVDMTILTTEIKPSLDHLIQYICEQCHEQGSYRNYTQQQIHDIQYELERIRCRINYYTLKSLVRSSSNSAAIVCIDEMKMLTSKSGSFTGADRRQFDGLVEEVSSMDYSYKRHLIREEPSAVVHSFQMETEQWFACRNNHVYHVDQVDGSSQQNKCPLCVSKTQLTTKTFYNARANVTSLPDWE